jgi:hypothetical protein
MQRFYRETRIGAALLATAMLVGCNNQAATPPRRPADIVGGPAATAPPPQPKGRFASAWVIPTTAPSIPAAAVSGDANDPAHEASLRFIATSPIFQLRVDGSSFDAAIASINAITAELNPEVAKGFQQSVRLLMIAHLPIEKARAAKRNVTDAEIHAAVLEAVGNKTPWEILVAAQQQLGKYHIEAAKEDQATPIIPRHG